MPCPFSSKGSKPTPSHEWLGYEPRVVPTRSASGGRGAADWDNPRSEYKLEPPRVGSYFTNSRKVIVPWPVLKILDEHIARSRGMADGWRESVRSSAATRIVPAFGFISAFAFAAESRQLGFASFQRRICKHTTIILTATGHWPTRRSSPVRTATCCNASRKSRPGRRCAARAATRNCGGIGWIPSTGPSR